MKEWKTKSRSVYKNAGKRCVAAKDLQRASGRQVWHWNIIKKKLLADEVHRGFRSSDKFFNSTAGNCGQTARANKHFRHNPAFNLRRTIAKNVQVSNGAPCNDCVTTKVNTHHTPNFTS
jgi:hypothetical protein